MPRHSRHIRLYDGRKLGFAEYGDPKGIPVVVCHGTAASRLQTHPDESIACKAGVRLIVPDRPGHGLSDFQKQRTPLDWPDDLVQLADRLEIERFAMLGLLTGGGVYALHCAFKIPQRLTAVSLVSCRATVQLMKAEPAIAKPVLTLARHAPALLNQYLKVMGNSVGNDPKTYLQQRLPNYSEVDRNFLNTPVGEKIFCEPLAEANAHGSQGIAWDLITCMRDWEFELSEIDYPVTIWHGSNDNIVPIEEAKAIAAALPRSTTHFIDGEGQFLFINHWQAILDDIVQAHCHA